MREKISKKNIVHCLILLGTMFLAIAVWYAPIFFQGYSFNEINSNQVLARNLVLTGKFSLENEKNVILSSQRIAAAGVPSAAAEKLIPAASAAIYKIFGVPKEKEAILIGLFIYAVAFFIFSLLVWKLFDFKTAWLFSWLYIFLPVNWGTSLEPNAYEYCLLFLAGGLLVFFWPTAKAAKAKYIAAGFLLALSFFGRNASGLIFPALLLWLFLYDRRAIWPFFASLLASVLIISSFFTWILGAGGNYHFSYFGFGGEKNAGADFGFYGHFYPDPYTYHFERTEYLQARKDAAAALGGLEAQNINKRLANVEAGESSLGQNFKLAPLLLLKHLSNFFSLYYLGGPFILLFMIIGWRRLRVGRHPLATLAWLWIASVLFFLSLVVLAQRNHLMDFAFILVILLALGLAELARFGQEYFSVGTHRLKSNFLLVILAGLTTYQLILGAKVLLGQSYNHNQKLLLGAYKEKVITHELNSQDIIATPLGTGAIYTLNYFTDKSFVRFAEETVTKLLTENKLDFAFQEFGVTKILGFSPDMSQAITQKTGAEIIADSQIIIGKSDISPAKGLLLNIIK